MQICADDMREKILRAGLVRPTLGVRWEKRFQYIEGSGFELTVGGVYRPNDSDTPFIGVETRVLPEVTTLTTDSNNVYDLDPGFYLIQSDETIWMPTEWSGRVEPRTSYFNAMCLMGTSRIAPGFQGKLRCALEVAHPSGFRLQRGAGFAAMVCYKLTPGGTDPYRGVWNGDKITTSGVERGY